MNSPAQQRNTVVALFKSHTQAEQAVKELQKAGFDMKQLSIVGRDYHTRTGQTEYSRSLSPRSR